MHVAKLRVSADENGLVPAGEYFKRLAHALREANEREAAKEAWAAVSARVNAQTPRMQRFVDPRTHGEKIDGVPSHR